VTDLLIELSRHRQTPQLRTAQQISHDSKRCLQAVSEISQGVAITLEAFALGTQQGVQVRGNPK